MEKNKQKYSDGRKNAFTKIGQNNSIIGEQDDGALYTMPDTNTNLRQNNIHQYQGYNQENQVY